MTGRVLRNVFCSGHIQNSLMKTNPVLDAIRNRRSVRTYDPRPLPADVLAAAVGANIERREPRGEILPGFGVIVPEGDHADGRAVFLSDEHLRHAAPPHGVARAVDDILEAVAVGPGPLLPEPAGDLLHMLRRVGQIPDMNYTHLHALLRLFSSV